MEGVDATIGRATEAIRRGDLVVYPTETVYGLGADALAPAAIQRVFAAKGRQRDRPLSMAVPDVETALEFASVDERTRAFMDVFLPGPVTVLCDRGPRVPDELTGGDPRVGIRVPDHPVALALLERVAPITATSANPSGEANVRNPATLAASIRHAVAVVVDRGDVPGGESTVVDPSEGRIHRRGREATAVEAWLEDHPG